MTELHPEAFALTAFRALPDGRGRQYTQSYAPGDPWRGCERMIRMARAVGFIAGSLDDAYACLDVVNEGGDILETLPIPHSRAFGWFYRKLHLRVQDEDGQ